jgi:hypothetical protein
VVKNWPNLFFSFWILKWNESLLSTGYGYGGGGLYNSVPLLLASAIGQARPAAAPAPSAAVPMSDGEFLGSGGSPPKQLPAAAPAPAHYTPPISTLMLMSMV